MSQTQPLPPFACTYTPNIPELLMQLDCSLIISTYQAGKVVMLSPADQDHLVQLPRNYEHPMGIAISGDKMAIASKSEVNILAKSSNLAQHQPEQPGKYDTLYIPRATYNTGPLDLHDLIWGTDGLWAVNTKFSCLSLIDENYSFTPKWQPKFISELMPEDRCHLNGVALKDGKPTYVSCLGESDTAGGWRANKAKGGILMDVDSNEIILKGLSMPHSPRIYDNKTFILISGTGELAEVDINKGSYTVINQVPGFARGMSKYGDYLFIGLSKIRTRSSSFQDLPISKKSLFSGIVVVHLPTGSIVGNIRYQTSVEEIFDVQVLPALRRPGILNNSKALHNFAIVTPTDSFWAVKEELITH